MKLIKPGMRTIKTGIGVMVCILIGYTQIVDKDFYAAIACIVCMQTTVKGSLITGLNRLKGTFIGGFIGFLFALIGPSNPVLSCLGIITTIYICNLLKINKSITIACVVYCSIHLGVGTDNPILYSIHRIIDTSVGVLVGVSINYFIYRPKYLDKIHNEIKIIENTSIKLLKSEIETNEHLDREILNQEILKLETLYTNFLDELKYSNDEIDDEEINKTIEICKQIQLHLNVLEQMKEKCYLSQENYIKSKSLYEELSDDIEVNDDISHVYNYHIGMIIEDINEIHKVDQNL